MLQIACKMDLHDTCFITYYDPPLEFMLLPVLLEEAEWRWGHTTTEQCAMGLLNLKGFTYQVFPKGTPNVQRTPLLPVVGQDGGEGADLVGLFVLCSPQHKDELCDDDGAKEDEDHL